MEEDRLLINYLKPLSNTNPDEEKMWGVQKLDGYRNRFSCLLPEVKKKKTFIQQLQNIGQLRWFGRVCVRQRKGT